MNKVLVTAMREVSKELEASSNAFFRKERTTQFDSVTVHRAKNLLATAAEVMEEWLEGDHLGEDQ